MSNRLPVWFKQGVPSKEALQFSRSLKDRFGLNTVCHSAKCPNRSDCSSRSHATFLILGDRCTRNCKFCNIEQLDTDFAPAPVDSDEPFRISQVVQFYNIKYAVITSVTRDDLSDGGAEHFAQTVDLIKRQDPSAKVEVLIPDFAGSKKALETVVRSSPDVVAHNLETVERVFDIVRDRANYQRSLELLKNIKSINPQQKTKSSLMLGLGETEKDLGQALVDLRRADCDMLVLGQYLRPSEAQYPVEKFYRPEEFKAWGEIAYSLGFKNVCALPLARTSYLAQEQEKCTTL